MSPACGEATVTLPESSPDGFLPMAALQKFARWAFTMHTNAELLNVLVLLSALG